MPEEKTPEQLAQEAIDAATQAASQAQEVAITLATGQIYKGKDYEEVARKIAAAEEEASRTITRLNKELEQAKEYEPEPEPKTKSGDSDFDPNKYYELLSKDPKAAGVYQSKYALAEMLGVPVEDVQNQLGFIRDTTQHASSLMAISAFHAKHPEFSGGEEASQLILERLDEEKLPRTTRNLEIAYYDLKREGKIKEVDPNTQYTTPQAPPNVGGSGGSTPNVTSYDAFYNLPADKMEEVIMNLAKAGYK